MAKIPLYSDLELFSITKLTSSCDVSGFSCPFYPDYQDFLHNKAQLYDDTHTMATYILVKRSSNEVVAYFSLLVDVISIDPKIQINHIDGLCISALKIHRLAASESLCHKYYDIVAVLLNSIISIAHDVSKNYIPIRFITLDADEEAGHPDIVSIYQRNGFVKDMIPNRCPDIGISMVYDLYPEKHI